MSFNVNILNKNGTKRDKTSPVALTVTDKNCTIMVRKTMFTTNQNEWKDVTWFYLCTGPPFL